MLTNKEMKQRLEVKNATEQQWKEKETNRLKANNASEEQWKEAKEI